MNQDGKSATLTAPNGDLHPMWMRGAGCVVGGEEIRNNQWNHKLWRDDTMSIPANLFSSYPQLIWAFVLRITCLIDISTVCVLSIDSIYHTLLLTKDQVKKNCWWWPCARRMWPQAHWMRWNVGSWGDIVCSWGHTLFVQSKVAEKWPSGNFYCSPKTSRLWFSF